jgi:hypothetical protein
LCEVGPTRAATMRGMAASLVYLLLRQIPQMLTQLARDGGAKDVELLVLRPSRGAASAGAPTRVARGHGKADKPARGYTLADMADEVTAFMNGVGLASGRGGGLVKRRVGRATGSPSPGRVGWPALSSSDHHAASMAERRSRTR